MNAKSGLVGTILLALLAATAFADTPATQPDTQPDTQPTTQAATEPAEPRDALRDFVAAIYDGRPDDVAPLCQADDALSKSVVDDYTHIAAAVATLRKNITDKFGPDEASNFSPALASPDDVEGLDQAIHGDHAELHGDVDVDMIRVNGQWKVDVGSLIRGGALPPDPDAALEQGAKSILRTAADVTAGKLVTVANVEDALRARLESIPSTEPTTDPATEPSTQP